MGRMVKKAIKRNGKTVTQVASELGISRNTLYNKFKLPYLRKDFMIKLSYILGHNFSKQLSYLKEYSDNIDNLMIEEIKKLDDTDFSKKYFSLLEKYNQLLIFLLKISNNKNSEIVKKEVSNFVKQNLI